MTARIEFSRKMRAEIILRATDANGVCRCEICGGVAKPVEVDHIVAEVFRDHTMQRNLTPDDGRALCKPCHKLKSDNDKAEAARVTRRQDKASGAFVRKTRPMPGSKASGLRKRMDGTVERRT